MESVVRRPSAVVHTLVTVVSGACIGALWFIWNGGWQIVDPRNVGWLLQGDWAMNFFGWLYYEPAWTFPLGRADRLLYPLGGSLAGADSIPIAGVLAGPWLSGDEPLQYFGIWMFLCFVLQGV